MEMPRLLVYYTRARSNSLCPGHTQSNTHRLPGNSAGSDGGGLLLAFSTFATRQPSTALFLSNQCLGRGGGLFSTSYSAPVTGPDFGGTVQLEGNAAKYGGGLYLLYGALRLAGIATFLGAPPARLEPLQRTRFTPRRAGPLTRRRRA